MSILKDQSIPHQRHVAQHHLNCRSTFLELSCAPSRFTPICTGRTWKDDLKAADCAHVVCEIQISTTAFPKGIGFEARYRPARWCHLGRVFQNSLSTSCRNLKALAISCPTAVQRKLLELDAGLQYIDLWPAGKDLTTNNCQNFSVERILL